MKNFKIPESVLVVIHTAKLDILLIKRADADSFWQSVTGSKDALQEDLRQTAQREVTEETGIAAGLDEFLDWSVSNIYEIYPAWRRRYAPGITHNTEHVFSLCVSANSPVRLNPREHSAYRWMPYLAAADACFSPSNSEAILMLPRFLR